MKVEVHEGRYEFKSLDPDSLGVARAVFEKWLDVHGWRCSLGKHWSHEMMAGCIFDLPAAVLVQMHADVLMQKDRGKK